MITRLQNFFLKHNKWLFGGLIIIIIVTFVLTIGPQSFFGPGGQTEREELEFFGYDLSSQQDQREISFKAEISAMLNPELRIGRDQLMDYAYLRVAALGIAERMGIPNPNDSQLTEFIQSKQIFQDRQSGEFSSESYNQILDALQSSERFSEEDLARVLKEDYRIARVRDNLGGPSYVLPFQLKKEFINLKTEFDIAQAKLNYSSFSPEINPAEEDLKSFYESNSGRYEVPERVDVQALLFDADLYLDDVKDPSEAELTAYFNRNKSRYQPEEASNEEDSEEDITLAEVHDEVLADWRQAQAKNIAERKSENFSVQLWEESIEFNSDDFNELVEKFDARVKDLDPYSRENPPTNQNIPRELLNSMWMFSNSSRYFSDIGQTDDGAVILVFEGIEDAHLPPYEDVADQVAEDFRTEEKRSLFSEFGKEIHSKLAEALEVSPDFESAVNEIESDLEYVDMDSFTGESVPNELRQNGVWEQSRYLDKGEVSPMIMTGDNGVFVFMEDKVAPEIDTESEEYQTFIENQNRQVNQSLGWSRLREITDEAMESLLGTP